MNLAVNGLHGSVMQANTYTEDPHGSLGQFDYVMANLSVQTMVKLAQAVGSTLELGLAE